MFLSKVDKKYVLNITLEQQEYCRENNSVQVEHGK